MQESALDAAAVPEADKPPVAVMLGDLLGAVVRLRAAAAGDRLADALPTELMRLGLPRSRWTPVDPVTARFAPGSLEAEVLRRREPLVAPASRSELGDDLGGPSLLCAPVLVEDGVVGLVHAAPGKGMPQEESRALVRHLADATGAALERRALVARLEAVRQEARRTTGAILATLDEFADAEVEVARIDREHHTAAHSAAAVLAGPDSRVHGLLTRRELDVMRLMAAGETNAGIASRLVVSEGTVKSHVKHILRKLRAANRAEAVSRFVRLQQSLDRRAGA